MLKYLLVLFSITSVALAAGRLQNADFLTAAQITSAGGTTAQLLNTSKIFDSTNSVLLDTTIAGKQASLSSSAAVVNQFLTGFTAPNTFTRAQPAFTDLSGTISLAQISANLITNAKLAQMAAHTFKGNNTALTADALDLTATQLTAELNQFTSGLQGLVPASGGGTANFLRADGTFSAPPNSGGTVTSVSVVSANGLAGTVATATSTPAITLSTTITGLLKGNGTAISAAIAGTDYLSVLTGDVTTSGNAATIANDVVTFAKMQNIVTDSLIGRDTAATGDPESITLGASLEFSGSASIQRAALTGDVAAAANSNATTIANDAVTYAKMQNVSAASKLLGRGDSGSGDVQEITLGTGLTMTGTTLAASGGGGSTPYIWTGSHQTNCAWSSSSGSPTDFNVDSTCTFAQEQIVNFVTVVSADNGTSGNNLPGIKFTAVETGFYEISARFGVSNSGNAETFWAFWKGGSRFGVTGIEASGSGGNEHKYVHLSAIVPGTAGTAENYRLQIYNDAGVTSTIQTNGENSITWTVKKVN